MRNTDKILLGIAAGIVAGAVAGILLAPNKGSETRKKIKEQKKKMAGFVKEKYRSCKDDCNHLKEDIEDKVKEKVASFL